MRVSLSKGISALLVVTGVVLGGISWWKHTRIPFIQYVKAPNLVKTAAAPVLIHELNSDTVASFSATLSAQSVYVIDVNSSSTLLRKNENIPFFPASTAKMMTALVARQQYPLEDWVEVSPTATSEGTIIGLYPGESLTVADILKGLLIFSGNDAAEVLATHYSLGREGFIDKMNTLASQLHLERTHFTNPSGLDNPIQQTTARDLTILAKEIVSDDFLSEVVASRSAVLRTSQGRVIPVASTNYLLRFPEYEGIKTGTTPEAGEVLITKVLIHDNPVLVTIMKSEDRYQDTQHIVKWLNENYSWVPIDNTLK